MPEDEAIVVGSQVAKQIKTWNLPRLGLAHG